MPFGLTNAPATFQKFINDVLRPFLDLFCSAYLDDIIIYSKTLKEHKKHVRQVLTALSNAGLHLKPEKCEFHKTAIEYLGVVVSSDGIQMDDNKVKTIREWQPPKPSTNTVKFIQEFLGFANFYRRFIKGYFKVVNLLQPLPKRIQSRNGLLSVRKHLTTSKTH